MSTTSTKQARTTITQAPYYLARRLPFVAGNGSLSGRINLHTDPVQGRLPDAEWVRLADTYLACGDDVVYIVYSNGTPIAWSVVQCAYVGPFTVPDVHYSATTSRHQGIVRAVNSEATDLSRCQVILGHEDEGGRHQCARESGHAYPHSVRAQR